MATRADILHRSSTGDDRFFMVTDIALALVIVAGFSTQLAMGRSSFASPPLVHAHAIVFMGWVVLYVAQTALATSGNTALHRRLGWIGAGWIIAMVILGTAVTLAIVRRGQAPFFFQPLQFLAFDLLTVIAFAGLTIAAVRLRRRTDWHRRLHYCGMAMLLGPAFGRLLPMPLLAPWAWETTVAATLIFPAIGVTADIRRTGRAHPAWSWGIGTMVAVLLVVTVVTASPAGDALYRSATAGTPGATIAPRAFPPPPGDGRVTGRT